MKTTDKVYFATLRDMIKMLQSALEDAEKVAETRPLTELEKISVGKAAHTVEQAVHDLEQGLRLER